MDSLRMNAASAERILAGLMGEIPDGGGRKEALQYAIEAMRERDVLRSWVRMQGAKASFRASCFLREELDKLGNPVQEDGA